MKRQNLLGLAACLTLSSLIVGQGSTSQPNGFGELVPEADELVSIIITFKHKTDIPCEDGLDEKVSRIVVLMTSDPFKDSDLLIIGRTSPFKPTQRDEEMKLSTERAAYVRDRLIAGGLNRDRLIPVGYGAERPISLSKAVQDHNVVTIVAVTHSE